MNGIALIVRYGVHLLQLLYLANTQCSQERKFDEAGGGTVHHIHPTPSIMLHAASRDFRIPLQSFHLDAITTNVNVQQECAQFYRILNETKEGKKVGRRLIIIVDGSMHK